MSTPAATPEQLHAAFADAFNRHDADAIAALYEPDAVLVRDGGLVKGRNAIRAVYEAVVARRPIIELHTLGVVRAGDLAMLRGRWTWQATGPDGAAIRNEGRNLETVRRQPDGRWLFAIDDPGTT